MKNIVFVLFFMIFFPLSCQAQILRGYDALHQGPTISSSLNVHDGTDLAHLYFQKTMGYSATFYSLLAYDKDFQTLYAPGTILWMTIDNRNFTFIPQTSHKKITAFPFNRLDGSRTEVILTTEAIHAAEGAEQIILNFQFSENDSLVYELPTAAVAEWKSVISLKN